MRPIFKALSLSTLFFLAACTPKGEAERSGNWTLNPLQSSISYVTIKSGPLGEINTFNEISGGVSTGGKAEFVIALDSVHTNSETRDPRMKEHVFETAKYPEAKVTANLNMTQFEVLAIGNSKTVSLDMKLDMHGFVDEREFDVLVTRLGVNEVRVDTTAPLILDIEDFGFEAGIAKLQELANLESISPIVSATVSLTFER